MVIIERILYWYNLKIVDYKRFLFALFYTVLIGYIGFKALDLFVQYLSILSLKIY